MRRRSEERRSWRQNEEEGNSADEECAREIKGARGGEEGRKADAEASVHVCVHTVKNIKHEMVLDF